MNRLHGEIRSAVMSILNKNFENHVPPTVPEETRVINELLREYLGWNGYHYTEQILTAGEVMSIGIFRKITRISTFWKIIEYVCFRCI